MPRVEIYVWNCRAHVNYLNNSFIAGYRNKDQMGQRQPADISVRPDIIFLDTGGNTGANVCYEHLVYGGFARMAII